MKLKQGIDLARTVLNYGQRSLLSKMNMLKVEQQQFDVLIDGKIRPASGERYFEAINPSTGEVLAKIADASLEDMQEAVAAARRAFDDGLWSEMSVAERGIYLRKLGALIRTHAKELADLESLNVGKTIKQSTFIDVPTTAEVFEHFANVDELLKERKNPVTSMPVESVTRFEPMGVVGAIIPWNYPLIMAAWKLAPALAAGNAVVLKPSSLGSASIMKLAELINEVGFPQGVVNIVSTKNHEAALLLVKSPDVNMISFTGGTSTGKEIMRLAADGVKKVSLELGGKSANIVFADCDFETALGATMSSIFMNQGQMCTACSRLLLEDKIYDQFVAKLVEKTKQLKIGNALDYQVNFGPVISREHRDQILQWVEKGKKEGAEALCGGRIAQGEGLQDGSYFEPTILANVKASMTIAQEEIFGPVLCVMRFSSEDEAVKIANDSKYGLAACVWTQDVEKANRVSKKLQCGTVWVNIYGGFFPEASFGGYKQSGLGRESGVEGLLEYTQTKHVCTDKTPSGKPLVAGWF
ncbi:MAG: aldehyde dehydrogenase family protein [Candidatus Omnitrophica bacterium]|nr:aldehyde dehydrogenase family protein [Candidatus Omnitrophota bacterium]